MTNQFRMSKGRRRISRRHSDVVIPSSFDFRHSTFPRRGLSLLEVILAIAILGGALATIGELVRIGARNAAIARDLTTAQIYCETKMSEVAAGVVDLSLSGREPLDEFGEWLCAIETAALDQQELVAVTVTVSQDPDQFSRPVSFTMTRWMIDPAYAAECAAIDAQAKAYARQAAANAKQTAGSSPTDGGGQSSGGQDGGGQGGGDQGGGQGGDQGGGDNGGGNQNGGGDDR